MRGFLFNVVARVFGGLIRAVNWVSALLLVILGNAGHFLMNAIDSKRLSVYANMLEAGDREQGSELQKQSLELRLLASASQVRDHAKETDDWTDRHTEALNAIGDALIAEAGWEEENVHHYLKGVVESIDGLEYGTEEW